MTAVRCLILALLSLLSCLQGTAAVRERVANKKCQEFIDRNSEKKYVGDLSLYPAVHEISTPNCTSSVDLIVNGEEASPKEFPHQARLGYKSKDEAMGERIEYLCGGSLISERFVLTAAHCGKPKVVMLGEHDTTTRGDDEVVLDVETFIKYPSYRIKQAYHDIALVKLAEDFDYFSDAIRPACLWTSLPLNVSTVIATGFGLTEFSGNFSTVLMKVRLDVMSRSVCEGKFDDHLKFSRGIQREQLCVGSQKGGKDTCQGDSGGPIQTVTDIHTCAYHIVGVTSIGIVCGAGKSESVYTQVASYVDWIEQIVWPEDYRQYMKAQASDDRVIFPND